jgi:outer membrane protein TolC
MLADWPSRLGGTAWFLGLALFMTLPGCVHPWIMTNRDYDFYNRMSADLDHQGYADLQTRTTAVEPRTVIDPGGKEPWQLTLDDARRLALENNKQILTFGTQPGQADAVVALQLSQFDAFWSLGGEWSRSNTPLNTNVATVGTGQNAIIVDSFGSGGGNGSFLGLGSGGFGSNTTSGGATQDINSTLPGRNLFEIFKRNATGGTTRLSYALGYSRQNQVGTFTTLNPAWTSEATVGIEQPFLQGAGVEFNRAQIMIARSNFEQSVRIFESTVHQILRDTESAYWQLGFAYYDLYSREMGLEQGLATWRRVKAEVDVGRSSYADLSQAREQLEFFRAERIRALTRLLAAERTLRLVMGLPAEDQRQIIPADSPSVAEYRPDWETAVVEAATYRPNLVALSCAVRSAELELMRQQNGLMPDLSGLANWSLTGLDNQFDQSIDRLTDGDFESWTLGGRYRRQIGERAAHAQVRRAKLNLERSRKELEANQHQSIHELVDAYRNILTNYRLIDVQSDRRRAAATQVEARSELYQTGKTTLDDLLEAQVSLADAIRDEGDAISRYNQALIQWEFVRGTIASSGNVVIAEASKSRANPKLVNERKRMWEGSLPLRIWPGSEVHSDYGPLPTDTKPFYPDTSAHTGEVLEGGEAFKDRSNELTPVEPEN